jgi:hypothetical protein
MSNFESQVRLPTPVVTGSSPLLPQHLVDLFFKPRRFFTGQLALGKTPYALLVAWCYGVAASIDRIDQNLLRAQFGKPRAGWENFSPYIVDSWPGFWLFILASGALGGVFLWWLGGWWFSLRVRWSGVASPDRRLARLVMAYSAFIQAAPAVLAAALSMFFFASYAEAFNSEEPYSMVLLVLPFWSSAVSYTGVRAVFGASGWRPRLWFLILPCAFYVVALGVFAALFAFLGEQPAG